MLKKFKSFFKINESLAKNNLNVDLTTQKSLKHHEDPGINSLIKIIHWQGGIIVLLFILLIISIFANILKINFKLPNQEALQSPPPLELADVDYNSIFYNNTVKITHGATVDKPELIIIGKIYDGQRVLEKWPDFNFLVNNAEVPLTEHNSQYKINLNLKPGLNVIETAFRIDGKLYKRKQKVINFQPQPINSTTTDETISTQTTIPAGR